MIRSPWWNDTCNIRDAAPYAITSSEAKPYQVFVRWFPNFRDFQFPMPIWGRWPLRIVSLLLIRLRNPLLHVAVYWCVRGRNSWTSQAVLPVLSSIILMPRLLTIWGSSVAIAQYLTRFASLTETLPDILERCKGNAKLYLGREVQQDWKFIDVTVDYIF